jgi:hypothetical protein
MGFRRLKPPERVLPKLTKSMLTGTAREPQTYDGSTLRVIPTPKRRKPQLTSLEGVRCEMARIYREAEEGKRETSEASKLVYILGNIGKVLEVVEIEARLKILEAKTNAKQLPAPR